MIGISNSDLDRLSREFNIPVNVIKTVDAVESGGKGFNYDGKIIIQFEPSWFKRLFPLWRNNDGVWSKNGVEGQSKEWIAFNNAFSKNKNSAMESTSIGRMQVMGFHWKKLGFNSVGAMWDFPKVSEYNQLWLGIKFISLNSKMMNALKNLDWDTFAYYYNGPLYKNFDYHNKLKKTYNSFNSLNK